MPTVPGFAERRCVAVSGVDLEVLRSAAAVTLARLRRYSNLPDAYIALHTGNFSFEVPGIDGVIVYRPSGRFLIQFGGVFAAPDRQEELLRAFVRRAAEDNRRVISVKLLRDDIDVYIRTGFAINQLGASYARSLAEGFSLSGNRMAKIRKNISRAARDGVTVRELAVVQRTPQLMAMLDDVDRSWLKSKGFGVAELDFMNGERGGPADQLRRLLVAEREGRIVGYATFSPVFGRHAGWLADLTRRMSDAPRGTSDVLLSNAIRQFLREHVAYLHLGLTPFTGIDPKYRVEGGSPLGDRIVHWLSTRGRFVYPAQSEVAYKLKWQPDLIQPEYVAFHDGLSLRAVWRLLRVTKAVSFNRTGSIRGAVGPNQ